MSNDPSKNKYTVDGFNKFSWDRKRVWVRASRKISMGGDLWCVYGSGKGTHHNNRKQVTAEINANVKESQRQNIINQKQTRASNSAN